MSKLTIYAALLAAALLIPTESADLGKMKPVETVSLYIENNQVVIETDTEDVGRGADVYGAVENLKQTTSGTIYLDTADYLLVSKDASGLMMQIAAYLNDTARVCIAQRAVKVTEAASYLSVHRPELVLGEWRGQQIPDELCVENGRLNIKRK